MKTKSIAGIVEEIKKENGVEAIYLFGSQATGRAKPYSDTDICVVTGKEANRKRILSNSSKKIDMSIFWDLPLNVRYRVIKEGRQLYMKDALGMHRIETSTVLSYLDFKPLLDRHIARVLGG